MIGILALLAVPLAGYFLLGALRAPSRSFASALAELPTCFGLGAVAFFFFFLAGDGLVRLPLLSFHLFLAALCLLWIFRRIRNRPPRARRGPAQEIGGKDLLLLAGEAGLVLALVALALGLPLFDWEARILWALKAKILAAEPTLSGEAFRDPYRLHLHPRYPLLVPFLSSWIARNQGAFLEWQYQVLIGAFALLSVWQLHLLSLRLADRRAAPVLATVMMLSGVWAGALFASRIEIALAFFVLLSFDRLSRWLEAGRSIDLVLAGCFLYGGAMTKNEGALLALCALPAFLPAARKGNGTLAAFRAAGTIAGVFALLSAPWFARLAGIPPVSDEHYLGRLGYEVFANGIARFPRIAGAVLARVTDLSGWHLIWLTPPAAAATFLLEKRTPDPRLLMAAILSSLYFAGLLGVYAISPWRDIVLHVDSTFDRAALPLLPLFLLMIAPACGADRRG